MPRIVDIYNNSEGAFVFKDSDGVSPQGKGNPSPKRYGVGQYVGITDRFGEGIEQYQDKSGFIDNSGFGIGFRQPYVWTSPGSSDFEKNFKKFDTRVLPIGSAIRDEIRIGKFTASGQGILWLAKQQLLHQNAPFDETNIVDPTSHLVSTIRPASLGSAPRVTKHLSGGSLIGGILSLFGAGPGEPKSTTYEDGVLPTGPNINQKQSSYGLIRGNTAKIARANLNPGSSRNPGLLGGFFTGIFGKSFTAGQPSDVGADERTGLVYRADQDLYDIYIQDSTRTQELIPDRRLSSDDFQPSTRDTPYEKAIIQSQTDQSSRIQTFFDSMINGNLSNTTPQKTNSKKISTLNRNPVHPNNEQFVSDLNRSLEEQFGNNITKPVFYNLKQLTSQEDRFNVIDPQRNTSKITGETTSDFTRYNMGIYGVGTRGDEEDDIRRDKLNLQGVLDFSDNLDSNNDLKDIVKFVFHDIVNNKVAYFRSTLKSISDSLTPEWSDVRYIGRADKVYLYNGMTRSVSFNFRVYATSKKEMKPMWQRINYLYGMGYPSQIKEVGNFGINIPPYVKMTVGNLYKNQPIILNSIGLTVPDEASWEIDKGLQLPMMVELSIQTTILEKEAPRTNIPHFDDNPSDGYLTIDEPLTEEVEDPNTAVNRPSLTVEEQSREAEQGGPILTA